MEHKPSIFVSLLMAASLATGGAWAQSMDLPALPPGSDTSITLPPPPVVQEEVPLSPPPTITQVPAPMDAGQQNAAETAPQAAPAVAQLPTVVVNPSTTEQAVPAVATPTQAEQKNDFKPSYGGFGSSLLFSAQDVDRMKKVLYAYESIKRPEGPVTQVKDEFTELLAAAPTVQEPANYPSYYLSSIVYRSPKSWLFWMNGSKYTPKKMPGGLKVLSISPRSALFAWTPEYIAQAKTRLDNNMLDSSIPKHIKAAHSYVKYDDKNSRFTVMIAPNQSFVSASLAVYEGKHADKPVPEMKQEVQVDAVINNAPPVVQSLGDPDAALKATMQGLQQFGSNVGQLSPRGNPNAPVDVNQTANPQPEVSPTQSVPALPVLQRAQ